MMYKCRKLSNSLLSSTKPSFHGVKPLPNELRELVLSYRDYYGAYHHHKEQMAYTAAVLYLAASAVVVRQTSKIWQLPRLMLVALLVFSAAGGFAFVIWQLRNREFAAKMVLACTTILAKLLIEPAQLAAAISLTDYNGITLPRIVVDELDQIGRKPCVLK